VSEAFAPQDQTSINDKKILFVSHAYADMEHALLLKKAVDGCFANVIVFDASDSGTIKPGEDWVHSVLDNLRRSTLVIVIATERSMKRPWVWFEAGACWERSSKLLTFTVGKLHKGILQLPFGIYIALSLAIPEELESLFEIFTSDLGPMTRPPDFELLATRFKEIESLIAADHESLEDPLVGERSLIVRTTLPSLEEPQRQALKLLLLYGNATDESMSKALQTHGLGNNCASVLSRPFWATAHD
jgi:hypothetical protein